MDDDEIWRCSLLRVQLGRQRLWDMDRAQDLRHAAMLSRAVALWLPAGVKVPEPSYYAPWAADRRPVRQLGPQEIFERMAAWTAISGGKRPEMPHGDTLRSTTG